jgi:molybdate transport system substrate-binding protein
MRKIAAASLLFGLLSATGVARAEPVTVFAAASLTDAMTEIAEALTDQGFELRFSFAASSTLARQIEAGAPADIFFSANRRWMDYLQAEGLIVEQSRVDPIGNRLVLIAAPGQNMDPLDRDELKTALSVPDERLVLGDPAHVPAGIYAKQALESLGLWEALAHKIVLADNVRAALALVERGEAPFGVVYATDAAFSDAVRPLYTFPQDSHEPITYALAIVAGQQSNAADAVFDALTSDEAREVYRAYDFEVLQ